MPIPLCPSPLRSHLVDRCGDVVQGPPRAEPLPWGGRAGLRALSLGGETEPWATRSSGSSARQEAHRAQDSKELFGRSGGLGVTWGGTGERLEGVMCLPGLSLPTGVHAPPAFPPWRRG